MNEMRENYHRDKKGFAVDDHVACQLCRKSWGECKYEDRSKCPANVRLRVAIDEAIRGPSW